MGSRRSIIVPVAAAGGGDVSEAHPLDREGDLSMHVGLVGPAPWLAYPVAAPPPVVEMDDRDANSDTTTTNLLMGDTSARGSYGTIAGVDIDIEGGSHSRWRQREEEEALPFRQNALWSILAFSFFGLLLAALLAFTLSPRFQTFVVRNANALFTIPYVISFVVILACLAPWVPAHVTSTTAGGSTGDGSDGAALTQMNVGVIASPSDFLLILLVLIEWAVCLALMLVTLVAVHDGLSYISIDGVIVPRDIPPSSSPTISNPNASSPLPVPDTTVGGIAHNSPIILVIPIFALYSLFNVLFHTFSCLEAMYRRRHGIDDSDVPD